MTTSYSWTLVSPTTVLPPTTAATPAPDETTESGYSVIRRHFNSFFGGKNWDAIIEALGRVDDYVLELARNVICQFSESTAEGQYLDVLGSNKGIRRPYSAGLTDDQFRQLLIEFGTGQVTYNSVTALLECVYGPDALRAFADSGDGPWVISNGQTLVLTFEGIDHTVTFDSADFVSIGAATALEVAVVLARFFEKSGLTALVAVKNEQIRIFSPSRGLRSSVRVSGTANLGFDTDTHRIRSDSWGVNVAQVGGSLKVRVPATAPSLRTDGVFLVGRTPVAIQNITRFGKVATIETASPHGLTAGRQVEIRGYAPGRGAAWATTPTSTLLAASHTTVLSSIATPSGITTSSPIAVVSLDGAAYLLGGDSSTQAYKIVTTNTGSVASSNHANGATQISAAITVSTMPFAHFNGAGSALRNPFSGSVLVTGGDSSKNVSMFDGTSWSSRATMLQTRDYHGQATLSNGKVLIVGGETAGTATNTCEIYDPLLNVWLPTGSMSTPRKEALVRRLGTGFVLVAGGRDASGNPVNTCEIYNPNTGVWAKAAPMSVARARCSSVTMGNGEVLVTSYVVQGPSGGALPEQGLSEIYNPFTGVWRRGPVLSVSTYAGWLAQVGNSIYYGLPDLQQVWALDLTNWSVGYIGQTETTDAVATSHAVFMTMSGYSELFTVTGDNRTQTGRMNQHYKVASVIDSTHFTVQTEDLTFSSMYGEDTRTNSSVSRSGTTVTVTKNIPADTAYVWVNSENLNFPSGLKAVASRTSSSFTYTESGAATTGTVHVDLSIKVPTSTQTESTLTAGFAVGDGHLTASTAATKFAKKIVEDAVSGNTQLEWTVSYPDATGLGNGDAPKVWG